ncbi:MAG: beta-glucosidase [Phycisphaerae bacterium]|nr:beta-glucosidase [Phycisphaerae bacterium]
MAFRNDFAWGAATAAYQIEGAHEADGKGPSVWDMFCRRPGAVRNGDTGNVACDHYGRWQDDVALMREMGLNAYRLSISWPRVLPEGRGTVNERGLAFYERLIDALRDANIEPMVTLFHWDYPYALYRRGGWLNPDSPRWFADYARLVVERLSDRVRDWVTLNEPQVFIGDGHHGGKHAPGLRLPLDEVLLAGHNALLGHGLAAQAIRAAARSPVNVGIAMAVSVKIPASDSAADVSAARQALFAAQPGGCWCNGWWLDPVAHGRYPEESLRLHEATAPRVAPGDMETIAQPLDFVGYNIYTAEHIRAGADGQPVSVPRAPGHPHSLFNWPIDPENLYWGPKLLYETYPVPLHITENGMSNIDWVSVDGACHDPQRIDMTARSLAALSRAADDGVDVRGYYHWSLMDNFEWAEGYHQRFGLVHVDYATLKRTPKDSAKWYRQVIATNGANLPR